MSTPATTCGRAQTTRRAWGAATATATRTSKLWRSWPPPRGGHQSGERGRSRCRCCRFRPAAVAKLSGGHEAAEMGEQPPLKCHSSTTAGSARRRRPPQEPLLHGAQAVSVRAEPEALASSEAGAAAAATTAGAMVGTPSGPGRRPGWLGMLAASSPQRTMIWP